MLKHVVDRPGDQQNGSIKLKTGIKFQRTNATSLRGSVSSPLIRVTAGIAENEENYNGLHFHAKMSDRKLAVIRRRAETLRQRDREIRARLGKVRRDTKVITKSSSANQVCLDGKSVFDTGNQQPEVFPANASNNIVLMLKQETRSVDHENHGSRIAVCENESTDDMIKLDMEAGSDVIVNERMECDTVDNENSTIGSRHEHGELRIPAKYQIKTTDDTFRGDEELSRPPKNAANANVEKEFSRTPVIKLKAFVGERFPLSLAKFPKCSRCVRNTITPRRIKKPEVSLLRESVSFAEIVSPMNLGVSPMRISKPFKKSRSESTLTSHLARTVAFSKKRISKTILNVLKKD